MKVYVYCKITYEDSCEPKIVIHSKYGWEIIKTKHLVPAEYNIFEAKELITKNIATDRVPGCTYWVKRADNKPEEPYDSTH